MMLLLCFAAKAEEQPEKIERFAFPLSDEFLASTSEIQSVHGKTLPEALRVIGVCFGEGTSVEVDQAKKMLVIQNSHSEAWKMLQIIAASVGKSRESITKDVFGIDGSESCWDHAANPIKQ